MYQTNLSGFCTLTPGVHIGCVVASEFYGNNEYYGQGIQANLLLIENTKNTATGENMTEKASNGYLVKLCYRIDCKPS